VVDQLRSSSSSVGELLPAAVAIAAVTLVVRMAFVFALRGQTGDTAPERFVVGWSGMRGAVSLAAALAVPLTVAGRPQIVVLTFSLILVTLVGQGLTLPLVLRAVDLPEQRRWSDEEATARMESAQAALDRLDELEEEELLPEQQLNRLRDLYRLRFRACIAVLGGEDASAAAHVQRIADYGERRRELIGVERETLADLHGDGKLSNVVLRQIQRDLDLEEARLRA
ncbi:MAG TPA: cation:proton antiporter, partial [Solirubrobacteraceae bacterium]